MKKLIFTIFLIFGLTQLNLGQDMMGNTDHNKLSRTFVLTAGYGITAATTDYPTIKLGSQFNGSIEYNFPSTSNVTFGVRLFGARGAFSGKGAAGFTKEFKTPFHNIGFGPQITFQLSDNVYTTFSVGASYFKFYPKDINDNNLPNFAANVYDNNTVTGNAQLDLRFMTSDKISLNFYASGFGGLGKNNDYFDDRNSGDAIDLVFAGGASLSYYFGTEKDTDGDGVVDSKDMCPNTPMGVKVDDFGCPLDSDGDGVADYMDKCPGTPAGVKVDSNGCPLDSDNDGVADYMDKCPGTPAGVKVDSNGCPLDSDGDGVADYMDKCPDTPAGVKVDSNGCPLDSDGDGVPNYKDKCPGTPMGDKVDEYGCTIMADIEFGADANFQINSTTLLKADISDLNELANKMKEYPSYNAIVEGYTDATGTASYNLNLAKRRAESIINYLVKKGVDRSRFIIKSFGEANPKATNKTRAGRTQNRRVVVKMIHKN